MGTIDSVTEYYARPRLAGYVEISAVVPYPLFKNFLDNAMKENLENIFVFNLLDPANSERIWIFDNGWGLNL